VGERRVKTPSEKPLAKDKNVEPKEKHAQKDELLTT
jgi:hypothetical protein